LAPPDHPESNQGLARKLLLTPLNLAETNIHPITMDGYSPDEAAQAYQDHLTDFFGVPSHGPFPGFDLTFLGLGRDGHVASIFPNSPVFKENKRWVAAVPPPDHIAPPLARITVTMPVLDASRRMLILTGLKGKEALLGSILAGKSSPKAYPAFWLQPQGRLSWFIHEE
jgi:6-phosphogluconolactonase